MQGYVAAVFAAIVFAASGAADSAAQPSSPYAIDVSVLTGPQGGELTIDVDAAAETVGARSFEHVHVSLRSTLAQEKIVNLNDVPAPNGVATIELGPLERGAAVGVVVQVGGEPSSRTVVLRGEATARLRPDLVVAAVHAPPQTLTTRPVDVVADVAELNGDTAAQATLTLMLGPTPLAESKTVTVAAGGTKSVTFEGVKLESAMSSELTVSRGRRRPVRDGRDEQLANAPDRGDRARARPLERARPEPGRLRRPVQQPRLRPDHAVARRDRLRRFRGQGEGASAALVRIFYNDNWDGTGTAAPELAGELRVVRQGRRPGAGGRRDDQHHATRIAGTRDPRPVRPWREFADVLEDLVRNQRPHERALGGRSRTSRTPAGRRGDARAVRTCSYRRSDAAAP